MGAEVDSLADVGSQIDRGREEVEFVPEIVGYRHLRIIGNLDSIRPDNAMGDEREERGTRSFADDTTVRIQGNGAGIVRCKPNVFGIQGDTLLILEIPRNLQGTRRTSS